MKLVPITAFTYVLFATACGGSTPATITNVPNPIAAEAPARIQTLANFPSGTFLENLVFLPNGDALVTSYFDKKVLKLTSSGSVETLADLPAHPVAILPDGDGYILTAHGVPFTEFPLFTTTNRVLRIDEEGSVVSNVAAPDAKFLNGLVRLPNGEVLAADSIAGALWHVGQDGLTANVFLQDAMLAPDPEVANFRPGANGLKVWNNTLFVSNSSRGTITSINLNHPPALENAMEIGPVDDFTFLGDGSIAATTHGEKLIRVAPNGDISEILEKGCDGCTAVALDAQGGLVVLTTGSLLEGGREDARILRVALNKPVAASARLAAPDPNHRALDPLIGQWDVEMRVYPGPGASPIVSKTMTADREWILGGRYVQERLVGRFAGSPSERVSLLGYNALDMRFELTSVDTFEPGQMTYLGDADIGFVGGKISMSGESTEAGMTPEPSGERRILRFEIEFVKGGSIERIFVTYPEQTEFLFVEQIFTQKRE